MKKVLLFLFVAFAATMSLNAQTQNAKVMKVLWDGIELETFPVQSALKVVFEDAPQAPTTGTEKRNDNIDVNWVQLWEDGPKFAEYNVGAENNNAWDCGGYYYWGRSVNCDTNVENYKKTNDPLTDEEDTATNLWGSNWRMPTSQELEELCNKCDKTWTDDYQGTGVKGLVFTGKGPYKSNSIFLPAAGYWNVDEVNYMMDSHIRSSTLVKYNRTGEYDPYNLVFGFSKSGGKAYWSVGAEYRGSGYPVRAVLKEIE